MGPGSLPPMTVHSLLVGSMEILVMMACCQAYGGGGHQRMQGTWGRVRVGQPVRMGQGALYSGALQTGWVLGSVVSELNLVELVFCSNCWKRP